MRGIAAALLLLPVAALTLFWVVDATLDVLADLARIARSLLPYCRAAAAPTPHET